MKAPTRCDVVGDYRVKSANGEYVPWDNVVPLVNRIRELESFSSERFVFDFECTCCGYHQVEAKATMWAGGSWNFMVTCLKGDGCDARGCMDVDDADLWPLPGTLREFLESRVKAYLADSEEDDP